MADDSATLSTRTDTALAEPTVAEPNDPWSVYDDGAPLPAFNEDEYFAALKEDRGLDEEEIDSFREIRARVKEGDYEAINLAATFVAAQLYAATIAQDDDLPALPEKAVQDRLGEYQGLARRVAESVVATILYGADEALARFETEHRPAFDEDVKTHLRTVRSAVQGGRLSPEMADRYMIAL